MLKLSRPSEEKQTNKNPTHVYQGKDFLQKYMSEPRRKKADTKHPPALVPTVVGDGYLNVSHFLQVLQTDSLTAFALAIFKNTCVVNRLGKERLFLPLEQREVLLAKFLPTMKDSGSLSPWLLSVTRLALCMRSCHLALFTTLWEFGFRELLQKKC